ncbi:DUF4249 domain-containing protein [Aquimarina hainanensis]|uniref:DUF4249 domain-containing protein n=1 Tax=Aquimarina hainanensis TaxID=1578017 RepID=A0ABW5NF59_9FLAO|nr:DUF4249 domain-containing protein [Aquimarina sp. TRL1]QKX03392.1 DUF4249 domain-containing protein [Aquimarina sp. TRL1]
MKKISYILLSLLLCISCEEVVHVDIPEGKPRLVIDASFEIYKHETPVTVDPTVKLTLSAPFFDSTIPAVSDATVFVTDINNNITYPFAESTEAGIFLPTTSFTPVIDTEYELTVIYKEETYTAIAKRIPAPKIDTIVQGDKILLDGDETEVIITFTDIPDQDDFYLFDFDMNLFLASEDRFYQGETFSFSYFYEDMEEDKDVTIKILGVNKQYYNYMNLVIDQSDADGGPFGTPPVLLRGNIINNTTADNYPLGYFSISETDRVPFTIKK